jgi:ABC-type phosphate/phosphonate transport system ATPase subunit
MENQMVDFSDKLLKSNPLGDTTAENDNRMLSEAFIETADFRTLIESDDRTVVVGRRGTGKSALFYQLNKHWERDKTTKVFTFSPEDTQIIGFRSLLRPFSDSFNLSRAATRILWKYSLLMEIVSYFHSHYKLSTKMFLKNVVQ